MGNNEITNNNNIEIKKKLIYIRCIDTAYIK